MSHNVETMAYAGQTPWHGLGVEVEDDLSVDEFRIAAGLDWDVEKIETYYEKGDFWQPTGKYAVVRETDGQYMTQVSDKWEPVQNSEALAFFKDFIDVGDMTMHTGGSLQDGKIVWVLAKVKESFELFGGDQVDSYLLFTNPFIYGRAVDIRFTPIRVVCNNTLNLSLSSRGDMSVKLNHCKAFDPNMAKMALGVASEKLAEYKEMAEFLGGRKYKTKSVMEYFDAVFPASGKKAEEGDHSRNADMAFEYLYDQPGAQYAEGSWWTAFNSVTYMTDHILGHNDETRLVSSWYGPNRNRKTDALQRALEFAKAA